MECVDRADSAALVHLSSRERQTETEAERRVTERVREALLRDARRRGGGGRERERER